MKSVAVMVAASVSTWFLASFVVDARVQRELLFGMVGPLVGVTASWVLVERTFRRDPLAVTQAMIWGFALKLVFFGAYVVVMVRALSLNPFPFAVSFVSYFCGLYLMEALYLRRLFN
jgi:hypothetical protein